MAALFVLAGPAKLTSPAPFLTHMAEFKIPGFVLPAVILLELGAGFALLIGWWLPISAGSLSAFCALTAIVFHRHLGNRAECTLFFKDLAIAGALLIIATGSMGSHVLPI